MTRLYGYFYKVLWKLLTKANDANDPETRENGVWTEKGGKKAKKTGFAIVFAGCRDGDGASTMAFNFASAFAAYSSRKVALVDGNMRDPVLHHQFSAKSPRGLSDVLRGTMLLEEAILEIEPNRFSFLQAGGRVKSPMALFESREFSILVGELRGSYDLVIFDSAPLISYPETTLLASATNGLVMVLQAEKTRWEVARWAQRDLASAQIAVIGAILNKRRFAIPEAIYRLL
jgi:capsular exopolysaccharide synthesis family protein